MHNVHHLLAFMKSIRTAILEGRFPAFIRNFFAIRFRDTAIPDWAVTALRRVDVELLADGEP